MLSPDLVQKIRKAYSRLKSYQKVDRAFSMYHSSVAYVVKNDYDREKKGDRRNALKPAKKAEICKKLSA
jgi:hypothetical protein